MSACSTKQHRGLTGFSKALSSVPHSIGHRPTAGEPLIHKVTEKTFQEMYINVGMANCEK